MTGSLRCMCGGSFRAIPDLEGLCCDACNAMITGDCNKIAGISITPTSSLYTDERAKPMRGIDCNKLCLGTESKGRLEVQIPIYATNEESKNIIDQQLELLEYAKSQVDDRGLDIYASRGKKVE